MTSTLKLVLTDHWFEEIKSGRKTHEYRKATMFWANRISKVLNRKIPAKIKYGRSQIVLCNGEMVEFQKAYRRNPERMTFKIKSILFVNGKNTDLHIDDFVFDIELGERVK